MTTNGSLLDTNHDFINAEMSNVVLSIDGRPELMTICAVEDGSGEVDTIISKFKSLLSGVEMANITFAEHLLAVTLTLPPMFFILSTLGSVRFRLPVVLPEESEYSIRREDFPLYR